MTAFLSGARTFAALFLVTSAVTFALSTSASADQNEVVSGSGLESSQSSISVGDKFSCIATSAGGVKCWGLNNYGQLGNGTTTNATTPVSASTLTSGVTAISAGEAHACALLNDGSVKCWGLNSSGQLGNGTTTNANTPTSVSTLTSGVTAISGGQEFTCAIVTGAAKCWGLNSSGQIGDGTTTNRLTPTQSTGLTSGITAITTGGFHTCVITSGGGLKCWGTTSWSTLPTNNGLPIDIAGATSGVVAAAAGAWHTCFITNAGAAKCWGWGNYGALGDGLSTSRTTIGQVTGLTSGVIGIASGGYNGGSEDHSCALLSNNSVSCWGWNPSGQIGDGTTTTRSVPTAVTGLGAGSAGVPTTTTVAPTTTSTSTTTTAPTTTTNPATTTTTANVAAIINIQAPATTVAQASSGQSMVPTVNGKTTSQKTNSPSVSTSTSTTSSTSSTTLPNAGSGTTKQPPKISVVAAGDAQVKVGNSTQTATVTRVDNQLVVTAGALKAMLGAVDKSGATKSLDPDGNVRLKAGDKVRIRLAGFTPQSTVEAWLFSSPVLMGIEKVGSDGTVDGTFTIPVDAPKGSHRIAVVTKSLDGKPTTLTVGVMVGEWKKGANVAIWLIVLPIVLSIAGALILPATRRRRTRTTTS